MINLNLAITTIKALINIALQFIDEDKLIDELKANIENITNIDFDKTDIDEKIEKIIKGSLGVEKKKARFDMPVKFICINNTILDIEKIQFITLTPFKKISLETINSTITTGKNKTNSENEETFKKIKELLGVIEL